MKKFLILFLLLVVFSPICFGAQWVEIFEKQYVDFESIELIPTKKIIKFWIKSLRKSPQDKFLDQGYWYSINQWAISCKDRHSRLEAINYYDLNERLIYGDAMTPEWDAIAPETYTEGYYKLFCLVPFNDNPLLKHIKQQNY